MSKIWRNRIEDGDKTLAECPTKYKTEVMQLLKEDYESGVISAEKYNQILGI